MMFLFTIRARVKPKSKTAEKFADIGGAYVSCFISFKDIEAAEKLATLLLRDDGWTPEKVTEAWKIQKKDMRTKKEKQYYSAALKFGYCMIFHMWPKDAEDAGVEYEADGKRLKPARRKR